MVKVEVSDVKIEVDVYCEKVIKFVKDVVELEVCYKENKIFFLLIFVFVWFCIFFILGFWVNSGEMGDVLIKGMKVREFKGIIVGFGVGERESFMVRLYVGYKDEIERLEKVVEV